MDAGDNSRSTSEPQEARFVLKVQMTRDEFVSTVRRYLARRPRQWAALLTWLAVFGEGVVIHNPALKLFGLFFASYLLLACFAFGPYRLWSRSDAPTGYVLEVATSGVTTKKPDVTAKIAWGRFTNVMKCGDVYVLCLKRGLIFAPVRALPEGLDEQTFCDFVARCLVRRGPAR